MSPIHGLKKNMSLKEVTKTSNVCVCVELKTQRSLELSY